MSVLYTAAYWVGFRPWAGLQYLHVVRAEFQRAVAATQRYSI